MASVVRAEAEMNTVIADIDIGVVISRFGQRTDFLHQRQRRNKSPGLESASQGVAGLRPANGERHRMKARSKEVKINYELLN